jgi:tripartite ATP-independent transporter DctP family solute receptor
MIKLPRRTALVALAAPFIARPARAATHTLKLAYADVAAHPLRPVLVRFAEQVAAKTDNTVQVQVFSSGELGSQVNILSGLQTGIIDLCAHTTGFMQTIVPSVGALDLPYVFPNNAVAEKVLDGEVGNRLFTMLPAKGIYGLCWGHWGWRTFTTVDKPEPKPEDARGLRIRTQPGAIYAATFKALGAMPVAIDISELYVALAQHAVDALETPMISIIANKHYEVAKVVNDLNAVYNAGALMASKRKFDLLTPEQQAGIKAASADLATDWRRTMAQKSAEAADFLKTQGVAILPVDTAAYRRATQSVYTDFREPLGPDLVDLLVRQVQQAGA